MNNRSVINKLIRNQLTISCAESMTGGMFAKYIVDVPGTSAIFGLGIVTYSNQAKIEELGVKSGTLEQFGAISEETALEMVTGLYNKVHTDICIAVSGNAGPHPSEDKPTGLYYVGLMFKGEPTVYKIVSEKKSRNDIREDACRKMFELINNHL